jgi:hypothetical protein
VENARRGASHARRGASQRDVSQECGKRSHARTWIRKNKESEMKYKMQRLDKVKFHADALIQAGLGELQAGLGRRYMSITS